MCLALIAHGSRDPRWRSTFERLERRLRDKDADVYLCYMEVCPPTLLDVATRAAATDCSHLRVLPLFMAGGGHVDNDIPRLIDEARSACPDLRISQLPPIGEHEEFSELICAIAMHAAGEGG